MLTQLELLGATGSLGVDEDSGMSGSPLDGLAEYPMEQAEFEYFETSLGSDAYYDGPQHQDLQQSLAAPPDLTSPSMCDIPAPDENILIYDQENIPTFTADDLKFTEGIKPYEHGLQSGEDELKFEEDIQNYERFAEDLYEGGLGNHAAHDDDFGFGNLYDTLDPEHHISSPEEPTSNLWSDATITNSSKGKIGPLQRRALDSIFRVTEKPSRGLVLHIASELGLHHLTVKNFFSNGRRRLRRAAARLNDPERTRRENERRKEKRRLAALASAAQAGTEGKGVGFSSGVKTASPRSQPADSPPPREAPVVSPERKALMEKLADKVQRSVAQRSLAADLELPPTNTSQQASHTSHPSQQLSRAQQPAHTPIPPHSAHSTPAQSDILSQSPHDLLAPAPHDLLTQSTHDLLVQSPNDFLDPSSASSALLQPPTDPWDLL